LPKAESFPWQSRLGTAAIGSAGPHNGDNPAAVNRHDGIGSEFVHRGYRVRAGLAGHRQKTVRSLSCRPPSLIPQKLDGRIERTMTDNGSCYRSKMFRAAYKSLDPRQIFTTVHFKNLQTALR
jgi:hypothetical protein